MRPTVVLDACVLVPYNLTLVLLALAEAELFSPRWSESILEEVERTLVDKLDQPPVKASKRISAMRSSFVDSLVYPDTVSPDELSCDPKDRHVLAAAIAGEADAIVTNNLKDFPPESCEPFGIVAVHPDQFLLEILSSDSVACTDALARYTQTTSNPALTLRELLARTTAVTPNFANLAYQIYEAGNPPMDDEAVLVISEGEDNPLDTWPQGHDPSNPLHVAIAWMTAIDDPAQFSDVLRRLCHDPMAFGDFEAARNLLEGKSLATGVHYAVDDSDIVFMKFVPEVAQNAKSLTAAWVRGPTAYLTLIRSSDQGWKVWSLGPAMMGAETIRSS